MDTAIVLVAQYFFLVSIAMAGLVWLRLPAYQKRTLATAGITGGLAGVGLIGLAGALTTIPGRSLPSTSTRCSPTRPTMAFPPITPR